jgi:hypothetical protein
VLSELRRPAHDGTGGALGDCWSAFTNVADLATEVTGTRFNVSPVMAVSAICALYVLLGTAMEHRSE